MILRILAPVALLCLLLVSSCKHEDPKPAPSKTDLLTQHAWRFSTATSSSAVIQSGVNQSLVGFIFTFKSDHTYTTSDGDAGTWEFSSNETAIITDKNTADEETYTVGKLEDANLELSISDTDPTTNQQISVTLKFVKG